MPPQPLAERERVVLAKLQTLVAERAAAEEATASRHTALSGEADRDVQRARRTGAASRKSAVEALQAQHAGHVKRVTDGANAELERGKEAHQSQRKRVVDQYSAALQKLRAEQEDKYWSAESVREAGLKEAEALHLELTRKSAASGRRLETVWADVAPMLRRVGLTRDSVAFDVGRLPSPTPTDPVGKVQKCLEDVDKAAARVTGAPLDRLVGVVPVLVMVLLFAGVGAGVGFGSGQFEWPINLVVTLAVALVGTLVVGLTLRVFARRQVKSRGEALGVYHAEAGRAVETLKKHADSTHAAELKAVAERYATDKVRVAAHYEPHIQATEEKLAATLADLDGRQAKHAQQVGAKRRNELAVEHGRHQEALSAATAAAEAEATAAEERFTARTQTADGERDTAWTRLSTAYRDGVAAVKAEFAELTQIAQTHFPAWTGLADAPLPVSVPAGVRYGTLSIDQAALPGGLTHDPRLADVAPVRTDIPAFLPFPERCAVLLRAKDEARPLAVGALQTMMLRFLTAVPPGKVRFTVIDPVGLGENFAAFMHLADADEKLVTSRIWTEPQHIEKRLTDLTEHMETVIQKYLRNQYKSIEEYNSAAGEVAEPYRVLVIANFPVNFTPEAARRLISVMASGPACGVCTLVSVDESATLPRDFRIADLEQVAYTVRFAGKNPTLTGPEYEAFPLALDMPPTPDVTAAAVRRVGQASLDAARVEVPFEFIMPPDGRTWISSSAKGFEVPIGRSGATKRQLLTLGRGTAQHALVAGKTGSGKSTLLHALITNLALYYSPDEAELYLIDFKKGVEFQAYAEAKLPHARVIAIESEREFGLSVLQRLDGILRERGDRFRDAGVNDLAGYREHIKSHPNGVAACPRVLLIVDEFQEFFVEDDKLTQEAALLLDRLVRQGRAFGVHLLLGSQTLGGAYSLARSTIDQMAVRIALQCSEADAQLILSKDNTAARLLNRPGEAIYNDANGLVEGNDPFQVVWLSEGKRAELLAKLREQAAGRNDPPMLVFAGSTHADLAQNELLQAVPSGPPVVYLGDPVAIKEPTAATFRPQSGANLLMLGQQDDSALALFVACLVSLRHHAVSVVDGTPDDMEQADTLRSTCRTLGMSSAFTERSDLPTMFADLAADLERRQRGEGERTPRFLLVNGLHRLRELRKAEDDYGFGRKGDRPATPAEAVCEPGARGGRRSAFT